MLGEAVRSFPLPKPAAPYHRTEGPTATQLSNCFLSTYVKRMSSLSRDWHGHLAAVISSFALSSLRLEQNRSPVDS